MKNFKFINIFVLIVLISSFSLDKPINYSVNSFRYMEPSNNSFVDQNFYNCVIDAYNSINNESLDYDVELTDEQLLTITSLSCRGNNKSEEEKIVNTNGLEKLTNLVKVYFGNNNISNIDLSNNKSLSYLEIENNKLTSLDTSNNTKLTKILASGNEISLLDVTDNIYLTEIYMSDNNLIGVDLSTNVNLLLIDFNYNELKEIDLSKNTELSMAWLSANNISNINISNNLKLNNLYLNNNELVNLDISKNKELDILYASNNKLTSLNLDDNEELDTLYIANNRFSNLDLSLLTTLSNFSIIGNSSMQELKLNNTKINELSINGMENLISLEISNNTLSRLIIEGSKSLSNLVLTSKNLKEINIDSSSLEQIDLSKNTNLTSLIINNSKLKNIDLTNNSLLKNINLKDNNFLMKLSPILKNTDIDLNTLDRLVILPSNIVTKNSNVEVTDNLKYENNVIKTISEGEGTFSITRTSNTDDVTIDYEEDYSVSVYYFVSSDYDLNDSYVYVGDDSDSEILSKISASVTIKIEEGKLRFYSWGQIIREFIIVRFSLGNLISEDKTIIINEGMSYDDFVSNLSCENSTYKIYDGTTEVISGEVSSGMQLKVYYNDIEVDSYDIIDDYINLDNLNIKDGKYIIKNISTVGELRREIETSGSINIYDKDGNTLEDSESLTTGSKVKIELSNDIYEYIVVIIGDVTGSGNVFIGDISKLYRYYKDLLEMEECYIIAGDVTYDGVIEINDIAKLYQYFKGVINSLE